MTFDRTTFDKVLRYAQSAPVETVLDDLSWIGQFDAIYERKLAKRTTQLTWLAGLTMVGGFVLFFLASMELPGLPLLVGLWLAVFVLAIIAFLRRRAVVPLDLENRRYGLLAGLLRLLRVDMDGAEPVTVDLDLGSMKRAAFRQGSFQKRGWKVTEYVGPWLTCAGRLLDGTRFKLTVVRREHHQVRWKTNSRGKSKRKTKVKSRDVVQLLLRPKAELLQELQRLQATATLLPRSVRIKRCTPTDKGQLLEVVLGEGWDVQTGRPLPGVIPTTGPCAKHAVAMMFLSMFNQVNRGRAAS